MDNIVKKKIDKKSVARFLENNAIIILMLFVAVGVGIYKPSFVSMASFKNLALNTAVRFIIADLAKAGKSIIMITSEMSELLGMSDRIMVMCDGRVTGFLEGESATQENVMALATKFE